ncbi:urease accessory protein UreE [Sphingobacterium suaedae]|uniref:Urease accessory protein UreE n=1 Tax=Sphingobacterium suaedae TaxID=1686402 RepID=A0ABW5KHI9_9SPHI
MLIARAILGNVNRDIHPTEIDYLFVEWYDTSKKVIRAVTQAGREIGFRNLTSSHLSNGDILYSDDDQDFCVVVQILPCPCIVFRPDDPQKMANICFEIGNRHIPIFINKQHEVIIAYERALLKLLARGGMEPKVEIRVIENTNTLTIHRYASMRKKIVLG